MSRQPLFAGLVYNEASELVETAYIGTEPHYVINDDDFKRHIEAEAIDRQVLEWLREQASANKELVSGQIMQLLGKDDLFTKAMIDSSISNIDEKVMAQGIPVEARNMLGMIGFKIIVNVHGEVVKLDAPDQPDLNPGDW